MIDINSFCYILFFDVRFQNVLNRNKTVIIHKIIVIMFLGNSIVNITLDCTNIINRKIRFIKIDTISN